MIYFFTFQVDMLTQGDSIYDIIDKRDHSVVQSQLNTPATPSEKEEKMFFCRMNVSRSFRRMSGFGEHKVGCLLKKDFLFQK